MGLRFLERELRRELAQLGREELMDAAVGGIGLTDDGGTIYVHLFPKEGSAKARGRAFVLAGRTTLRTRPSGWTATAGSSERRS